MFARYLFDAKKGYFHQTFQLNHNFFLSNKDRANTVLKMNALYFIAHIFCLTHAFPLPDASKKITQLSETIHKKDVEMQGMEERYKKYIEKVI